MTMITVFMKNDYDEKESIFSVFLKVEGDCSVSSTALVSANLESGGKAGEEILNSLKSNNCKLWNKLCNLHNQRSKLC